MVGSDLDWFVMTVLCQWHSVRRDSLSKSKGNGSLEMVLSKSAQSMAYNMKRMSLDDRFVGFVSF